MLGDINSKQGKIFKKSLKKYVLENLLSDLKINLEWLKKNQMITYPGISSRCYSGNIKL